MVAKDIATYLKSAASACLMDGLSMTHLDPEHLWRDDLLSNAQKRAILADWASDARAVEYMPGYRQLDNGALVFLEDIWVALRKLDADTDHSAGDHKTKRRRPAPSRVADLLSRQGRSGDGGNDPLPTLAVALPRSGGGSSLLTSDEVPPPGSRQAA